MILPDPYLTCVRGRVNIAQIASSTKSGQSIRNTACPPIYLPKLRAVETVET